MAIKLPDKGEPKKVKVPPMVQNDALSPQDAIEYGITMEVSPSRGSKAWIKLGTTSSVRDGETTANAMVRVAGWVEEELERRIEELS